MCPLSHVPIRSDTLILPPAHMRGDGIVYAGIAFAALSLWWLSRAHAAWLPFWAPWDFSFVEFLSGWLAVWWYLRGLALTPAAERPSLARRIAFFAGIAAIYVVLETRFEYLAEHQFFFNRIQHVAMHHAGPFLIALAWPGATLMRGMPGWARRLVQHPVVTGTVHVLQQPALAAILFSGSFFFWLIPAVHFRAMIDPDLFALMNWTMVGDGILFWCLVLDPRPHPPARASFGARAALAVVVMFPQIIIGAMITFNPHDLYAFYDLCGRIYPELGAHYDQTVGGLIIWIPPAMMSVLALLLVLNLLRRSEESSAADQADDENDTRPVIDTRQWTGS
jgi:putative membrane protein